jgi:hypothetical protein
MAHARNWPAHLDEEGLGHEEDQQSNREMPLRSSDLRVAGPHPDVPS